MNNHDTADFHIWGVTIHDLTPQGFLAFDLKDVLRGLGLNPADYLWVITELDCLGAKAQSLVAAVEKAGGSGAPVSGNDLVATCEMIDQTLDATLFGAPRREYSSAELALIGNRARFPESHAELVISAVDSSFFEVITKNYNHVRALSAYFLDVRAEDLNHYFLGPGTR